MKTALFSLILVFTAASVYAADEFTTIKPPNEDQKLQIKDLEARIAEVQRDVEKYYIDLKDSGRVDATGLSKIPITSEIQTYYGQRERFKLDEQAVIVWKEGKITSITFEQRRGMMGQGYVVKKRFSGSTFSAAEAGSSKQPIDLLVQELLESGRGLYVNFRFPTEASVKDHEEEIEVDGVKRKFNVVFVRETEQKIDVLREYLRLCHVTWRRIDWIVRAENARKAAEISRILRTNDR